MARTPPASTFQELILRLMRFWTERGCLLAQPFDAEKGAGTYNPSTFLRALGPEPWRVAYVEPSRRPTDGRYGENPNRLYRHHQFQVLLKPSPPNLQGLYLESLRAIGIHPEEHDIRFVEDNWESPTLGAWGLGWEVWVDGMEATQFTYFQQCGGLECRPVSGELTYGLERLAMYLQDVDDVYELAYAPGVRYGDVFRQDEVEYSKLSFEALDRGLYSELYERMEKETERLVRCGLPIPAYDHLLHAAHAFNALDARGAISVTERQGYILRIRDLARMTAEAYLERRAELGFPLGRVETTPEAPSEAPAPGAATTGPLLVELGTEELPAKEVLPAATALADGLVRRLDELRLGHGPVRVFATPRRLAVLVLGVEGQQPDRTREVAGPPLSAAKKDGAFTKAAEGFARGQGVEVHQLVERTTPKGTYLFAVVEERGQTAAELLPAAIEAALGELAFTRRMRWGSGEASFSRPVAWLLAVHAGAVLRARFAGVEAGSVTYGHRFLAPEPIDLIDDTAAYPDRLKEARVIADPEERRARILDGARRRATEAGGRLHEDPALLAEITQLVEWPNPLLGNFEERFLAVPKEVLMSEMMEHQRYLPVFGEDRSLLPCFVVVAGTEVEDEDKSLAGYRRVLSARFADGAFFFTEDQRRPLPERVEELSQVRFHRALGSVLDKVERIGALAFSLARLLEAQTESRYAGGPKDHDAPSGEPGWALARAARLCKADLGTRMVFEFPELQGVIGEHYARIGGEPLEVAAAVREHYLPRGADDGLPEGEIGALVGLADRLDTLAGIFGTGKGPSGTADPFGLRRAALGVLRVVRARQWRLPLSAACGAALDGLGDRLTRPRSEVESDLAAFFRGRLKAAITAEGVRADVAEAALAAGDDDPLDAANRALALAALRDSPGFEPVAVTFKRVANLLRGANTDVPLPSRDELEEPVERALFDALVGARQEVEAAGLDHRRAFVAIAGLRPLVDGFFEGVMVLADDPALRARRVGLLAELGRLFAPLADFGRLS